eukprot:scaffold86194_cov18-Tisochrysis_lutea.AAC.5
MSEGAVSSSEYLTMPVQACVQPWRDVAPSWGTEHTSLPHVSLLDGLNGKDILPNNVTQQVAGTMPPPPLPKAMLPRCSLDAR